MAFDGLHIIWTTCNASQPHDARGDWSALRDLYKQLAADGHYYELSASLPKNAAQVPAPDAVALSLREQNLVADHLFAMTARDGDRIAGDLTLSCHAVNSMATHLLFVPALSEHSQIIGRLKSKIASQVLRTPERRHQKHIWSRGYWFANLHGPEAIEKVEQFVLKNAQVEI